MEIFCYSPYQENTDLMRHSHDPRSLAALSFRQMSQRYPHYARILTWLSACRLIRRPDIVAIGWPEGTSRQNRNHGLRQLLDHGQIEAVDRQEQLFKLGRRGARLLQEAGIPAHYRATPRPSAQPGLILAGEFAVALGRQLMWHRHISAMAWREEPFAGSIVRPDGSAEVLYTFRPRLDGGCHHGLLTTQAAWVAMAHTCGITLCLEVDRVTQFASKIEDRVRNWGAALQRRDAGAPPEARPLLVLWLTAGTWRRAHTIQRLWTRQTQHPALFTTVHQLRHKTADAPLDPLGEIWIGCDGAAIRGQDMFTIALGVNR
jgi:hypothetical protein